MCVPAFSLENKPDRSLRPRARTGSHIRRCPDSRRLGRQWSLPASWLSFCPTRPQRSLWRLPFPKSDYSSRSCALSLCYSLSLSLSHTHSKSQSLSLSSPPPSLPPLTLSLPLSLSPSLACSHALSTPAAVIICLRRPLHPVLASSLENKLDSDRHRQRWSLPVSWLSVFLSLSHGARIAVDFGLQNTNYSSSCPKGAWLPPGQELRTSARPWASYSEFARSHLASSLTSHRIPGRPGGRP